jgi:predicted nucleic acid-binding protein
LICIDTNVLIWGVQGTSRPTQTGMIDRTRRWLKQMAKDNEQIMVPSVVVAEYLSGFPIEEQVEQLQVLSRLFFLPAYDARCAALAAELQKAGAPAQREPGARVAFKADIQIIATAICHGATLIVTGNVDEYQRVAGPKIPISDVPEAWEQPDLDLQDGSQPQD